MSKNEYYYKKTDRELYKILKSGSRSTYDEKVVAQEILKERNFDFDNIEKYKDQWELEKLEKEIMDEDQGSIYLNLWYNPDFLFIYSIALFIGCILIIINLINQIKTNTLYLTIESFVMVLFMIIFSIFTILVYRYSRERREHLKFRQKRISELKSKLTIHNNG